MQNKLFANIKRMTTIFSVAIAVVTIGILSLRLTLFSDIAVASDGAGVVNVGDSVEGDGEAGEAYSINTTVYFSTPSSRGDILIKNPATNQYNIAVNLTLNDGGQSVYYSGYIRPGTNKDSVKLQGKALDEGVHECTATITAHDPTTGDTVDTKTVPVTLYVGQMPD